MAKPALDKRKSQVRILARAPTLRPHNPMAEVIDLKSIQYRFESDCGYQYHSDVAQWQRQMP